VQQAKNAMQQAGFCFPRRNYLEFQLEFLIETQAAATNLLGILARRAPGRAKFSRRASAKSPKISVCCISCLQKSTEATLRHVLESFSSIFYLKSSQNRARLLHQKNALFAKKK